MTIPDNTDDRAFTLGVLNGALWSVVTAAIHPELVLTAFLLRLNNSVIMATLPAAIMRLGMMVSNILIANVAETWKRKKPFYIGGGVFRVIMLSLMALAAKTMGSTRPFLLAWLFLILLGLYSAAIGSSSIGFNEIIAKTISIRRRGQLMGLRGFFGGIVGIGSGFYVRQILSESGPIFPNNYALLFATASFFLGCCLVCFGFVYEPAGHAHSSRTPLFKHIAQGISIFRGNVNFRLLFVASCVCSATIVGPVVYVPYAIKILLIPTSFIGYLLVLSAAVTLPLNFLWSYIGDRHGNRLLAITSVSMFLLSPILVLFSLYFVTQVGIGWETPIGYITPALICLILAQAVFTTSSSGFMISRMNYLLEIAPEEYRPSYIAFMNVMLAPTAFFPVLGGLIVEKFSFQASFYISFLLGLISLYCAYKLGEPRQKHLAES